MAASRKTTRAAADGGRRVRLQKVLAAAGVASRRGCEALIEEGRVTVNDQPVWELPVFVDPARDVIRVDGRRVRPVRQHVYYLVNKPRGVVCTASDPAGRPRVVDLVPDAPCRIFPVGRLDVDSTGLILLTNDGELANRAMHPRYGLEKTYRVRVRGRLLPEEVERLRKGIHLAEGLASARSVRILHRGHNETHLEITLREGRNRQVRRMLARLGHPVRRLARVRIGPLTDRGLGIGRYRPLTDDEVRVLYRLTERSASSASASGRIARRRSSTG